MSFLIAVHVSEGIILASDRRTTYKDTQKSGNETIQRFGIQTTDSTDKTFKCPNGCGISTCGDATLLNKPIKGYVLEFIRDQILEDTIIDDIPEMLIKYFNTFMPVPTIEFIVAGYKKNNAVAEQKNFTIETKSKLIKSNTELPGVIWRGEGTTISRILLECGLKQDDKTYVDMPKNEILWQYMTLQDAVDFVRYAVEVTIKTMRFQSVNKTVGGNIDILVIKSDSTKWLQKEELGLT